ncbi:hypothetical protein F4804DRAFT_320992 [Jackrogersella minutella]|nr:hypothetical protein F4804DRAFT_320992 [Jackrogersella minutella]
MTVGTWWHRRHDILEGNYNKKNIIKPKWPKLEEQNYEALQQPVPPLTPKDQRIKTTIITQQKIDELQRPKYQELIRKGSIQTGASVRPDGSQDNLIKIKGLSEEDHQELCDALKIQGDIANAVEPALPINAIAPEIGGPDLDEQEIIEGPGDYGRSHYFNMTCAQLVVLLRARKLPISGRKAALVERMIRNDMDAVDIDNWFRD